MLTVTNLSKRFGPQSLFEDVSLQFNPGNRYGIVGANGSGKSTFLRILHGAEEPSEGSVAIPRRARVGVLHQDHFLFEDTPIIDVVMMGNAELWAAMQEKDALLANAENEFDVERYGVLEDVILRFDGYAMEAVAGEILEGLAIPTAVHHENLSVLSGGFKLRVLLAQVLASNPELLMLDEPTNHLDILSIRWLEVFLAEYEGTALVISHDHRFLDNVCTHIVDVDYNRVMVYKGNYDDFEAAKEEDRDRAEAQISKREKEIAHHQDFVRRFKAKASKARQAQSRMKKISKLVVEDLPRSSRRYPRFRFEPLRKSGKMALKIEGLSKSYGDKQVLNKVTVKIDRGDRLAIIGPNGIGKSTLLKIAMGEVDPDEGGVEWGHEAAVGYFAQEHGEILHGAGSATLKSWLHDQCPMKSIGYVHGKLAAMLFNKDDVDKKLSSLSGGEVARLLFAALEVAGPNILVLDEPTNHLDIEGIQALAAALVDYEGTIIFVSHDRWFVGALATRILEVKPDGLVDFQGTYDQYLGKCGDDHLDSDAVAAAAKGRKK